MFYQNNFFIFSFFNTFFTVDLIYSKYLNTWYDALVSGNVNTSRWLLFGVPVYDNAAYVSWYSK